MISAVTGSRAAWSAPLDRPAGSTAEAKPGADDSQAGTDTKAAGTSRPGVTRQRLTADQELMISRLQARDRDVRAHEAAHKSAGGSLAGGMSFSYETGPDGRQYAVGGEVSIDIGSERDPAATVAKMRQVISAALAPRDPSSQDQAVAAQAQATMAAAEAQRIAQQQAKPSPAEGDKPDQDKAGSTSKAGNASASGYQSPPPAAGSLLDVVA